MTRTCPFENRSYKEFSSESLQNKTKQNKTKKNPGETLV